MRFTYCECDLACIQKDQDIRYFFPLKGIVTLEAHWILYTWDKAINEPSCLRIARVQLEKLSLFIFFYLANEPSSSQTLGLIIKQAKFKNNYV